MIEGVVGRRYAHALFGSAREKSLVDEVERDLGSLREVWEDHPVLARFLDSPNVSLKEKQEFLERVFPKGLTDLTRRFLVFLLEKKRVESFLNVVSEYHELADEMHGRSEAEVITRSPLSGEQREKLGRALSQLMGKTVDLVERVDPGVIGGLRVSVKDRVIDRTIRSRLVQLREGLLAARLLGT